MMLASLFLRNRSPLHNATQRTTICNVLVNRFWQNARSLTTQKNSNDHVSSSSPSYLKLRELICMNFDKKLRTLFNEWKEQNQVTYSSEQKEQREFKKFKENYEKVTRRYVIRCWFDMTKEDLLVSSRTKSSSPVQIPDCDNGSSPLLFEGWLQEFRKRYTSMDELKLDFQAFKKDYRIITRTYAKRKWFSELKSITNLSYDGSNEEISEDYFDDYVQITKLNPGHSTKPISTRKLSFTAQEEEEIDVPRSLILYDYFSIWCELYKKEYPSEQERLKRFKVFRKSYLDFCREYPNRDPIYNRTMTVHSDMTDEEVVKKWTCRIPERAIRRIILK